MFAGGFVRGAFVRKGLCPDTLSCTIASCVPYIVYNRVMCPMNCVQPRRVSHELCSTAS